MNDDPGPGIGEGFGLAAVFVASLFIWYAILAHGRAVFQWAFEKLSN